jgi:endonuclease G, mitochondrial
MVAIRRVALLGLLALTGCELLLPSTDLGSGGGGGTRGGGTGGTGGTGGGGGGGGGGCAPESDQALCAANPLLCGEVALVDRCGASRVVSCGACGTVTAVTLTSPASGSTVRGVVGLGAAASAPSGIVEVEYLLDGATVASASAGPAWSASWDSTTSLEGAHQLTAVAHDGSGGTASSSPVQVLVANRRPLGASVSLHLTLGIPDDTDFLAPSSASPSPGHYGLVRKAQASGLGKDEYALSYDSQLKVPNWVSWELNRGWRGSQPRTDTYRPDDTLPAALPGPQLADYQEPVYDRGHMCPSADRTLTFDDNASTFYLTNMVPQAKHNNQGAWQKLEAELQALADSGRELFIVAGPVFVPPVRWTLGGTSGVAVPTSTFKVAVVLGAPGQGVADVTASTRVIGVLMPNDDALMGMDDPWTKYCAAPRAIEAQTQLDFLADVPRAVQDALEQRCDPACDTSSASYQAYCR